MVTPLLRTKLYIPPIRPDPSTGLTATSTRGGRTRLVPRPRLIERLNAGLQRKLTLISAPAGFGKTTLLSEWASSCRHPIAWLSLDEGDNDPARFWAYLIAALQTIHEGIGEAALEALVSPQPLHIEALLTGLINEIAEIPDLSALVLDDFHVITDQRVNDEVTFFLDSMPPHTHLILSSRADPPWPLARLRARREMTELRTNDLRFTSQEAAAFLNEVMRLDLSPEDVAALEDRTEGWIAGLQMAALSMRGREDVSGFIRAFTGTHRFILDYLVEEVLDQQSPTIQEFLLKTSILERMTGPLCDAVTGGTDSQTILAQLEQANLFLVPLDDERRWYGYHRLFSELLRNQLALIHPEQAPVLHQRASEWFEEESFTEETIAHAFAARDYERVAYLVEKYARDMLHQSKYNVLSSWIEALPDELVQKRPWLCVYQSWTRHWTGMREGGEDCLKNAERALNSLSFLSEKERRILPGYIATVRAHYALTNEEIPRVIEQAQKALRLLPEDDYFTRGTAAIALGGAYWGMGDVLGAEQAFAECASNAMKGGYHYRASSALCYVGMQQVKQARLLKAEETFREALALSQGPGGRRFPNAGYPLAKLGELACEWNDLEQARRDVHDGMELCTQLGHVDLMAEAYVALARVQLAQRDFAGVKDTLQRADRLSRETKLDPWAVCWLDDCRLWLWLSMKKLDEATRWAEASGLKVDGELNYHHDLHHINLARVLIAQGMRQPSGTCLDRALGLLARLLEAAEKAGWIHKEIKILTLQALALWACDDNEGALNALARALTLAEPGGYVRTFIDEGALMGELLLQAAARGITVNYVSKLLAALEAEGHEIQRLAKIQLIEPLSERELEVLRLLATSLSTAEIANELFITVNTLRTHTKNIYGKLDVHSRREAVARAQELGLP